MLRKRFYIPIGALIIAIVAIGFFALRLNILKEPIVIYKTVTPIKRSVKPTTPIAEVRTTPASVPIKESVEDTPVSTSEISEYAEFSREELLERFPQYDFHSPASRANLRDILRMEKEEVALRARQAELKRKIAVQEAQKELAAYLELSGDRLDSEYPDVMAFRKKYRNLDIEDFIREYPDETERRAFMFRVLEAGKIQQAMAERILETPGVEEHLPSEFISEIIHFASIDIDKMIGGVE